MVTKLERRKAEEYEMQLFGFTSRAVCATLEGIVEEKIRSCCRKFSESLNKIYKPDENNCSTLRHDIKSLLEAYRRHSHHHTSSMKRCIRKLIAVPNNICLPEDECQTITYPETFQDMEKHLDHLQSRARKATMLQAALKEELRLIEEIEPQGCTVKLVSTVVESLTHHEVEPEMIKCVSSCQVVEDIVRSSSNEAANLYRKDRNNVYNMHIGKLNLEMAQHDL